MCVSMSTHIRCSFQSQIIVFRIFRTRTGFIHRLNSHFNLIHFFRHEVKKNSLIHTEDELNFEFHPPKNKKKTKTEKNM